MSKRKLPSAFGHRRNDKNKSLKDIMEDGTRKSEKDEDQVAKGAKQYIINTIEEDEMNHRGKYTSTKNDTYISPNQMDSCDTNALPLASEKTVTNQNENNKVSDLTTANLQNNYNESGYDGDDERGGDDSDDGRNDGEDDDEDPVDDFVPNTSHLAEGLNSNKVQLAPNFTNHDEVQASSSAAKDKDKSDGGREEDSQLHEEEGTIDCSLLNCILPYPNTRIDTDEYHSSDSDYYIEITIMKDKVIDDRKPDQDHVKERILYCNSCIKNDVDPSGSESDVTCLCYDCEKYLCRTCSTTCTDSGHLIAQTEDSEGERGNFCRKFVERLSSEDDDIMIARMNEERFVCTGKIGVAYQDEEPPNKIDITGMCYTEDGSKIALIDHNLMKLFNGYSYILTRVINFSDNAYGITEVPYHRFHYTPEKVSYFAITFPDKGQIMLVDIERNDDKIVKYIQLDGKGRQMWPRDICYRHDSTLIAICWHSDRNDATEFSIVEVFLLSDDLDHVNFPHDINSLPGPITAGDFLYSEFKLAVLKGSFAYFISSETNGYIKHITSDYSDSNSEGSKAFVSNHAVNSVICVDMKKNVFAGIGDESHEHGIYKSDEDLKIWKLCIPASDYIAGKSTLGMVHKDRLFLLTESEDGRQYITIFQNEVSDRGYGEGSPL